MQYPSVVSDLHKTMDGFKRAKSPSTSQIMQDQMRETKQIWVEKHDSRAQDSHVIDDEKDVSIAGLSDHEKQKITKDERLDFYNHMPSESSEDANGTSLQYPRVVADLDRKKHDME